MPWGGAGTGFPVGAAGFAQLGNAIFIPPSEDSTGIVDYANITGAFTTVGIGGMVFLTPGIFYINQKITVPPYLGLTGLGIRPMGTQFDWAGFTIAGSILKATSTFSGTAMLEFSNVTANETGGQTLRNFAVDMSLAPAGYGVHSTGSIAAVTIEDVLIYHAPNTGLFIEVGVGGGQGPDTWFVSGLKVSHCVIGIETVAADTWWLNCESSENTSSAWVIDGTGNSRYIGCKGENSGQYGWFINTGATAPVHFSTCTTQFNTLSGFKVTGPTAVANPSIISMVDCRSAFDGGLAGLEVNDCKCRVMATQFTTLTLAGSTPNYGACLINASFELVLTTSFLQGAVASTFDDGSNTHVLVNNLPVT